MSGLERYWLTTPTGRRPLDGSFVPDTFRPAVITRNLVRARGYLDVFDLSDGLPDPVPIVLKGLARAATEAELSRLLALWAADARAASLIDRDGRNGTALQGGSLIAVPLKTNSRFATVTITLISTQVTDPASLSPYFF